MQTISSFRDLDVWRQGMALCEEVFQLTAKLPSTEFDFRRQMRRAAVSIPSNVAEGYRRQRQLAYQNHVSVAHGSHAELDTQLELAIRTRLLTGADCATALTLLDRVGAMLYRLHESLE